MNKSGKTGFQEKTGFLCLFSTFGLQFSTDFYKVWFSGVLRSPWVTWGMKIRIPGKKPDSKIFRISSEMVSMRYFEMIFIFSFFEMTKHTKIWYKMVGFCKVSKNSKPLRSRIASGKRAKRA